MPKVRLDSGHARYAADGPPPVSMHDHPVIIAKLSAISPMVFLDGYPRAVRLWKTNDPAAKLAVFITLRTTAPKKNYPAAGGWFLPLPASAARVGEQSDVEWNCV